MKSFVLTALLVLGAARAEDTKNPLAKVFELMDDFRAKIIAEGEEADKAYREYVEWCDDSAFDKRAEIKTATSKKGKLEAAIDELTSEIENCDAKIEKLVKGMSTADKDLKDATAIREKEAAEFETNEAELIDTVDTLKRAISIVSKEMEKNPAFMQVDTTNFHNVVQALNIIVDAASFGAASKQTLMALVQANQASKSDEEDDQPDAGAPAAKTYESHSGQLVEMMEDLLEKAEEDLSAVRKAESNAKQNYNVLKIALDDTLKNGDKDMKDEKAAKSAAGEEKATSEKDLKITIKALATSTAGLEEVKSGCMQVASDQELSVAARNEELKVLADAKKVLQESTSLAQQAPSLVQMRSRTDLRRAEVLNTVRNLAKHFHSASLAQLASRIETVVKLGETDGNDPFEKIKGMISDLVAKLEKEVEDAAEEKAYCDDQMAKTKEKKDELEEDLEKLSAKGDKDAATSAGLKNEVKEVQRELAKLSKLQAELDQIRKDNNAAYLKEKEELDEGLGGVRKALSILKEYYGNKAAALLQSGDSLEDVMKQPAKPATFSKHSGAGGGIIGILEVAESDFSKSLAAVESLEADEVSAYEEETQKNNIDKTQKEQVVKFKTQEFTSLDKALADMGADTETMNTELKAVNEYWTKITDRCVAKPEGYEERAKRREQEIAGLKEALSILEQETALVQVRARHRTLRGVALKA